MSAIATTVVVGAASGTGRVRPINQDYFLVQDTVGNGPQLRVSLRADAPQVAPFGVLCAVADGLGGHRGGEHASRLALEVLAEEWFASDRAQLDRSETEEALRHCIAAADVALRQAGDGDASLFGMGTTVVGLLLRAELAVPFHAGDSRLYRYRAGTLEPLTSDHSLLADLQRKGQLTAAQAADFDRKQVLINCVGGFPDMEMYLEVGAPLVLQPSDRFLLCSDGVSNALSANDIASACRASPDPVEVAAALVRLSDRRGGIDNATAIVIDV